jgi:CRP/FNR family cyclic AMP-dependent transcriptional regulator
MEESVITVITKESMITALNGQPKFSQLFTTHLLGRNDQIEADLVNHLFNSSEKRLARLLLLLANYGKAGTPQPIAAMTCPCKFPPRGVRVRPSEGRINEAS